jgi:hypothetical protein
MGPINIGSEREWKILIALCIFGAISACGYILYALWYVITHLSWTP